MTETESNLLNKNIFYHDDTSNLVSTRCLCTNVRKYNIFVHIVQCIIFKILLRKKDDNDDKQFSGFELH